MKPKFNPKDRVMLKHNRKTGYILECINKDDIKDIRIQGFRYYIQGIGQIWSATEQNLYFAPSKIKGL